MIKKSESKEMYLEVMLELFESKQKIRLTDIAEKLNISKPSVNNRLNKFKDLGLINKKPYSEITFTEKGLKLAKKVKNKHRLLTEFFDKTLKVDLSVAEENACRFEHSLTDDMIIAIKDLLIES